MQLLTVNVVIHVYKSEISVTHSAIVILSNALLSAWAKSLYMLFGTKFLKISCRHKAWSKSYYSALETIYWALTALRLRRPFLPAFF